MVEEARFKEEHEILHGKLFFTALLTIVGGATTAHALLNPFEEVKLWIGIGSALYMIILGIYTAWLTFYLVPTCFRGTAQSSRKTVWLQSRIDPQTASYRLMAVDPKTGKSRHCEQSWNVGNWIHEDGTFSGEAFCSSLATFVTSEQFKSLMRSD